MSHTELLWAAGLVALALPYATSSYAVWRERRGREAHAPRPCAGRCGRYVVPPDVECAECHDARQW